MKQFMVAASLASLSETPRLRTLQELSNYKSRGNVRQWAIWVRENLNLGTMEASLP